MSNNMKQYEHQQPITQHPLGRAHEWRASVLRRLPWDALLAFFGILSCAAAMIAVIIKSQNDLVENWTVSPAVYLAIFSVVANVLLRYTFAKGVEISWWVTALKEDTQVKDLHNIWLYGTSLVSAVTSGRDFNLIALAAILLALVPANAPLAQRASAATSRATTSQVLVSLVAAQTINNSMTTGQVSGRSPGISYITPDFATALQNHLVSAPISIPSEGISSCVGGICRGVVRAAGYSISCIEGSRIFDRSSRRQNETSNDGTSAFDPATVFGTSFGYFERPDRFRPGEPVINLTATFKHDRGCNGTLFLRNCTLTPATLEHRVVMANSSIALDDRYTYIDDKLVAHYETLGGSGPHPSYHGGLSLALNNMFASNVTLNFAGAVGMVLVSDGVTALRYQRKKERLPDDSAVLSECLNYWLDPTHDILMAARAIAFRVAFEGNLSGVAAQLVQAERTSVELVYRSDYMFLGLALMMIGLSALTVLPLLRSWWRLGRQVSLSPIEVARAFGAPELLVGSASNSDAGELIGDVGVRGVRYGEVVYGGGQAAPVLAFANPAAVQPPQTGVLYF